MTLVNIKIETNASVAIAALQIGNSIHILGQSNIYPQMKFDLEPGSYNISFSSFANPSTATATITVWTSAADKISKQVGVDAHGQMMDFCGFVLAANGELI